MKVRSYGSRIILRLPRTLKEHDVTNRTLNTNDFHHGETNAAMVVDERCSIGD